MISNNENEQLCYCPTKIDYSSDKFAPNYTKIHSFNHSKIYSRSLLNEIRIHTQNFIL